jgi:hypothetical protein
MLDLVPHVPARGGRNHRVRVVETLLLEPLEPVELEAALLDFGDREGAPAVGLRV